MHKIIAWEDKYYEKLLIMCGAGHATSTVVRTKVNRWLKEEGLENQVEIKQSAVGQELESIKMENMILYYQQHKFQMILRIK